MVCVLCFDSTYRLCYDIVSLKNSCNKNIYWVEMSK